MVHALHVLQLNWYTRRGEIVQDRVHIDVAGPMTTKSAGGQEYEYIDDYNRALYTNPLRLKSDALEAFKIFIAAVENESQRKRARVE